MPLSRYVNKVEKGLFDSAKPELCFSKAYTIDVEPKALGSGFGWQGSKPSQTVDVKMHDKHVSAQTMTSVCAQVKSCPLSKKDFLANARALPKSVVMDLVKQAKPRTFLSGSFGWHAHTEHPIKVRVAGKDVLTHVNFTVVLQGTKPEGRDREQDAGEIVEDGVALKRRRLDEDLFRIAKERSKDGILCSERVKSLWIAAMDDNRVTETERTTLEHIMASYAMTEKAKFYLTRKLVEQTPVSSASSIAGSIYGWFRNRIQLSRPSSALQSGCIVHPIFFNPGSDDATMVLPKILEQASRRLDVAVFCLTDDRVAEALIRQHKKGIQVRVFTDNDMEAEFGTSDLEKLRKAGVQVRMDRTKAHMHHKFVVVDETVVVNGSLNWTTGAIRNNRENIVISRCPRLAAPFVTEFERLWDTFAPTGNGKYIARDGVWNDNVIALFFPDRADVNFKVLVNEVRKAKTTLDVAVFLITVRELESALKNAHSRGVRVRVIMDDRQATHAHKGAHLKGLRAAGIEVRTDHSPSNMHHKFCVIDNNTLCNGSFNWTRQAEDTNYENVIIYRDNPELARSFTVEFDKLWVEFKSNST